MLKKLNFTIKREKAEGFYKKIMHWEIKLIYLKMKIWNGKIKTLEAAKGTRALIELKENWMNTEMKAIDLLSKSKTINKI